MFNQQSLATAVPAPLDPNELEACLLPFGHSRLLPKAAYVDPAVLDWERAHVFSGWSCVGRIGDLTEPGAMRSVGHGDSTVLLVRDASGELRGFENACRHRGHELLPCGGSSRQRAIVCPYHAWTYELDGSLRGAPSFAKSSDFDRSRYALNAIPVVDWHGWVFVDPSGSGGSFAEYVGELETVVSRYEAGQLVTAETHSYDVAANWKVIVENYQECYHCPMIHPELCRVSPPHSGDSLFTENAGEWVGGWMDLRDGAATMSLDGHSAGVAMTRLDEHERRTVMYIAVLPNLLVSLHPDYVMTHLLTPLSPDLTHIQCSWAFAPTAAEQPDFDPSYAVDFWDLTNRQDWNACESVQRGLRAPRYTPGPLAPEEDGVYQFVTKMARRYLGG